MLLDWAAVSSFHALAESKFSQFTTSWEGWREVERTQNSFLSFEQKLILALN